MPVKSLSKVQKHISKKKGASVALHEDSRDFKRLQRATARQEKVNKLVALRNKMNESLVSRIAFFHAEAKMVDGTLSVSEMQEMISRFIGRSSNELESVKAERRPGRPPSTREDQLKQKIDKELGEYRSGFWMPDFADAENLKELLLWHGEWAGLARIKFVRIYEDGTRKESSFPPKGQS